MAAIKCEKTFNHLPSVTSQRSPPTTEVGQRRSEMMKAFWKDPAWRAKREAAYKKATAEGRVSNPGCHWGFTRKQLATFRRQARFEATLTMKKLEEAGVLDDADEQAKAALHVGIETMRNPTVSPKDRLTAARLVLDFTKAKPAQKQEITVTKAEEWLEAVTKDNGKETDEGTSSGA